MDMTIAGGQTISSIEQPILDALWEGGPLTLDTLSALVNIDWAQAFLVVDRLSRSRQVTLHRTESREYLVSINTANIATRTALRRPVRTHE